MNKETILVPDTGSDGEMEVIELSVAEGDVIEQEQTLIVLESDKATMEIPSTHAGKLLSLKLKVGDKVRTGDEIAEVELKDKSDKPASEKDISEDEQDSKSEENVTQADSKKQSAERKSVKAPEQEKNSQEDNQREKAEPSDADRKTKERNVLEQDTNKDSTAEQPAGDMQKNVHAGPAVRKFAREHGVELSRVKPSGPRSRILQEDVSEYIKQQVQAVQSGRSSAEPAMFAGTVPLPDFKQFGEITTQSMSKIHLKTAENMQRSWGVPQVTQFDEADITELEDFRKRQAQAAKDREVKLTPMPFILKACAYVLKALPQFNVSLDLARQQLIQKHYVHIGFAVDTPHGLLVPVIRDVDKKGLWQLAAECQDLADRARDKKLKPAEMQGACFTISSLGSIGGTAFTPIVSTPEVAILGVSRAQMKPVYTNQGEFEARLLLPLSLSYDHRAVNGADGARFTRLLAKLLSDLRELLL